jgi:hypothetical protein
MSVKTPEELKAHNDKAADKAAVEAEDKAEKETKSKAAKAKAESATAEPKVTKFSEIGDEEFRKT